MERIEEITSERGKSKMKFIKVDEDAVTPVRATKGSAGYDIYTNESVLIPPNKTVMVGTGLRYEGMPEDEVGLLLLRSSVGLKRGVIIPNGMGVLDSDYQDEFKFILTNITGHNVLIDEGEKLGQMVIVKFSNVADETTPKNTRSGGFGSTDKVKK